MTNPPSSGEIQPQSNEGSRANRTTGETSRTKSAPDGSPPEKSRPPAQADAEKKSSEGKTQMLGEFRLLRRLGKGGMAEVYLAEQTTLGRNVAIKVLRPALMADATYRQRFQTEAMAAAGLNHSNIVQVYLVGEAGGIHYIAQEYVQGKNLREFMARKGSPDLVLAVHIMKQVAAALNAASNAGIIHRDIKPENIMITRKGEVKVADFGLAKLNQENQATELTQTGITMGTPLYMSPEQIDGRPLDHRSDIYSFGVTCYHMLAGSPPFQGGTAMSVAAQHIHGEAKPLEEHRPDLPPALCRIVHKMMARKIEDRYPSAVDVVKDLRRLGQERSQEGAIRPLDDSGAQASEQDSSFRWRHPIAGFLRFSDRPVWTQMVPLLWTCLVVAVLFAALGWVMRPANPLASVMAPAAGGL